MSELRDVFERQLEKMREEVRVKEQDLQKVRTGGDGSNFCHLKSDLVFAIPKRLRHHLHLFEKFLFYVSIIFGYLSARSTKQGVDNQ